MKSGEVGLQTNGSLGERQLRICKEELPVEEASSAVGCIEAVTVEKSQYASIDAPPMPLRSWERDEGPLTSGH